MATVKQVLDGHFLTFIKENGLESLQDKMIETITKCEYELDDVIESMVDNETMNSCDELENDIDLLNETNSELEDELIELKIKLGFFIPETVQDEFKIQWVKENWDNIKPL